ncbi:MAG: metallophosphoesterase [Clostridium sp.]|nr:metallophosphoesterase [Clostridium sp.]
MMKNILIKVSLITILICILPIVIFDLPGTNSQELKLVNAKTIYEKNPPKLVFPVISDVHIGRDKSEVKFKNALNDLRNIQPKYDSIVIVGDITNCGENEQYKEFMDALYCNRLEDTEPIITMGNHEYYISDSNYEICQNRFLQWTGNRSLDYDRWIKGYHFIMLSPHNCGEGGKTVVTKSQLNWLQQKLNEKEGEIKPIFVFLHQPIENTVYGSRNGANIVNSSDIKKILKKHKEVIYFSGHSHYLLGNDETMHKDKFIMFNTGSVSYMLKDDYTSASLELSQGLLVKVYDDRIIVRCREFSAHNWIGKTYIIKIK